MHSAKAQIGDADTIDRKIEIGSGHRDDRCQDEQNDNFPYQAHALTEYGSGSTFKS